VYLSISAELLNREGWRHRSAKARSTGSSGPVRPAPRPWRTIARRLGEAQCPVIIFGDDVWRAGAQAESVKLAELLEAPVFASRQIFVNFPSRHPLYCGTYPITKDFEKISGLKPDLLFLVGCQASTSGDRAQRDADRPQPAPDGPPLSAGPGRAVRAARDPGRAHRGGSSAFSPPHKVTGWARQRAKVRAYAKMLIEREENLVREHEHDPVVHPAVLEAHLAEILPRETTMVQESSTARTTLLPFGHEGMA
jgi:thiamine pyrophosphate-dependent acetolactate synthase large subunit-like protein